MTIEEKRQELSEYCERFRLCGEGCMFASLNRCDWNSDEDCERLYEILHQSPKEDLDTPTPCTGTVDPNWTPNIDIVNHPPHYCREDAMECIEEMELIFGKEAVKHFCLCNAWKYRYRSSAKNGEEDIKKSDWYIRKYKELTSNE